MTGVVRGNFIISTSYFFQLSFFKVFEELEKIAGGNDKISSNYASQLLEELKPYPLLREGFEDPELIEKYKEQIDKLLSHLFPSILTGNEIKGAAVPFQFMPFYKSARFEKIIQAAGDDFTVSLDDMDDDRLYIIGCTVILQVYYGYKISVNKPFKLEIPNKETGKTRFYRSAYNADMIDVVPTENAIDITENDYNLLLDNFNDIDLWKEKFPPNSWVLRGFGIMNLQDITIDQTIDSLTSDLLEKSEGLFERVVEKLRSLLNIEDLNVAYMVKEHGNFVKPHGEETPNMLLGNDDSISCQSALCDYGYKQIFKNKSVHVISDVPMYHKKANNYLSKILTDQKIKSYIIIPLIYNDEFVGFLELGSFRIRELNSVSAELLKTVLPILSVAANRFKQEVTNQLEAVIQENFTSIQPSVKWKFEEEASKFISSKNNGVSIVLKDIVFKEVFPLYGQMDIKNSSTIRNDAIKSDLISQLSTVKNIMQQAYKNEKLPLYDEMTYRIKTYIDEANKGILAGSEHTILDFLESELYPVFDHLKTKNKSLEKSITNYLSSLNSGMNLIYDKHKDFDESVGIVNSTLADFFDKKQIDAQAMFPHYYERFKTDGVEINMYIGDSLSQTQKFNPLFHRNLQLWQLITMCEAEYEVKNIQNKLNTPLEVASLILIHADPLSIHFRIDEKRFDVEGAYNARYEITKKRIDKAHIKNTKERITIPGKIAIIYSNKQDAIQYKKYIKYLQAHNYLKTGSIEDYELENLQGITGLRALRVTVNYESDRQHAISVDDLISSLEN